jgi:hypothetical protein
MFDSETDIPDESDTDRDAWFAGPDGPVDDVDPALADLTPNIHYHRPIIMIAVMSFAVYLLTRYTEEVEYLFGPTEAHTVGNVIDFAAKSAEDPGWRPNLPHNRLVDVSGIPSRTSLSCQSRPPTRYFKLVGGHVYVEEPLDDMNLLECEARAQRRTQYQIEDTPFFEGRGRAISMKKAGDRYQGFRIFYERSYGDLFCASITEAKREERRGLLRQVIRASHKSKTGQEITDEALATALDKETICHEAWLIQIGKEPQTFASWLWPPIGLILIILWDIVALILWTRRTLRVLRA